MEKDIYSLVYELLLSGQKIVLARTIRRSGSTPRGVGSMCIITEDEKLFGTIGGGLLEYKVQKQAIKLFKEGISFIYRFHLTAEDLAETGMICGGDVDLYLEPLFPENSETVSIFGAIKEHIDNNKPGVLATRVEDGIHALDTSVRMFIKKDGTTLGRIPGIDVKEIDISKNNSYGLLSFNENSDIFVEKIALHSEIIIFGAGHVSLFVAQLAKMVGFKIIIIDDRPEFANRQRFPLADEIIVTDFKQAFERLAVSQNSYILIITRGHLFDKVVLEYALGTKAFYIGMIGSIKKRNIIYRTLMEEGVSKEELEKVYSPVGIDINAETPEEIAVSIVGELIKKNRPKRKSRQMIV
ncbi:MAG: XdhC family protein [Desulfobacteraceae bacterium]|nr:XdhC family protein [Desulfobacteraceae bacterium]